MDILKEIHNKGHIVLDDILDSQTHEFIKYSMMQHGNWKFSSSTTQPKDYLKYLTPDSQIIPKIFEAPQFTHSIFDNQVTNQVLYDATNIITSQIQKIFQYKFYIRPIQYKCNFQYSYNRPQNTLFNSPHIDFGDDIEVKPSFVTIIYYLNNTDGDTYLFNQLFNGEKFNKLDILTQISPKSGRCVIFPTNRMHTGGHPTQDIRVLLNLNLQIIPI